MKASEALEIAMSQLKSEIVNPPKIGGQSCGIQSQKVRLISEDFNIVIEIGFYRSQIKNYEKARILMELALMDMIKL